MDVKNIGLRGVTVADSKISFVDGDQGVLLYRGYPIQDLAQHACFEEVVFLLVQGRLPSAEEIAETRARMAADRPLPAPVLQALRLRARDAKPMDVLQGALSTLADHEPLIDSVARPDLEAIAYRTIARVAMIAAAWHRIRAGLPVLEPEPHLGHAAAFLKALRGTDPSPHEVRLMDTLLVIHAEHTFNASTFAVRQVASTYAHMIAALTSGVGALSGALHGGANARVMQMLLEIETEDRIAPWVRDRMDRGQRVMGLGHAVYRTEDPRADLLRQVAERALAGRPEARFFQLALRLRDVAQQELERRKGLTLYPNVDFYSGPVLHSLGLAPDMFPVFFAVARVAGWAAHVIEERLAEAAPKTALYRPKANYVGRKCGPLGCSYLPPEDRGIGCPCGLEADGCDEALDAEETWGIRVRTDAPGSEHPGTPAE